jgi:hypothetical protein
MVVAGALAAGGGVLAFSGLPRAVGRHAPDNVAA